MPSEWIAVYPISSLVASVRNDDPEPTERAA